jgi:hypothetical protein
MSLAHPGYSFFTTTQCQSVSSQPHACISSIHRTYKAIYDHTKQSLSSTRSHINVCTTRSLQKVLAPRAPTRGNSSSVIGHGAKDLEFWLQILAKVHDRCDVATAITIVGRRPDCNNVFVFEMVLWMLAWSRWGCAVDGRRTL